MKPTASGIKPHGEYTRKGRVAIPANGPARNGTDSRIQRWTHAICSSKMEGLQTKNAILVMLNRVVETSHRIKPSWFRFSLRAFLVGVTLLAILAACAGDYWKRVLRQRAIVRQLQAAGGDIYYDYQDTKGHGKRLDATPYGPALLRSFLGDDAFSAVDTVFLENTGDQTSTLLELLPDFPKLENLYLRNLDLSDDDLRLIATKLNLVGLSLTETRVSAKGLAELAASRRLSALTLHGTVFGDDNIQGLADLTQLTHLQLIRTDITSTGFASLSKLKRLRRLDVWGDVVQMSDNEMTYLAKLTMLEHLDVQPTAISDLGLKQLQNLRGLRQIRLRSSAIADDGIQHLVNMRQLEVLDLTASKIGDAGLEQLACLESLADLKLHGTKVTDAGIPHLARLRNLRFLDFTNTVVTDASLSALQGLTSLERISVGPHVTCSGAQELQKILPHCTINGVDPRGVNSFLLPATDCSQ